MSLTVTQRPNSNNAFSAVGNPILYKMQRKDFTFSQVNNSGGFVQLQFNLVNYTGSFASGDSIYVQSDNGIYDDFGTVTGELFATNTLITTDIPYTSAAPGGFCNNDTLRASYCVEIEVYDSSNNLLNDDPFRYSPDTEGLATMDISAILKANMTPDSFQYLTSTTNATSTFKTRQNTNTGKKFYIKYREIWVGSAESQTNDSANQMYAVYGARQIPSTYGGYLKEYAESTGRYFLTKFDRPKLWIDRKNIISFIDPSPSSTNRTHVKKTRYNSDGTVWGATYDLSSYTASLGGVFDNFEDCGSIYNLIYDSQVSSGTTAWSNLGIGLGPTATLPAGGISHELTCPIFLKVGQTYTITVTFGSTGSADVLLEALRSSGVAVAVDSDVLTPGTQTLTFSLTIATADCYYLGLIVIDSGGGGSYSISSWTITGVPTTTKIEYELVTLTTTWPFSETQVSQILTVYPTEPCSEAIQLMGTNSIGGCVNWIFDGNQEYGFDYGQNIKNARKVLQAVNVTMNEWEALQDFIGLGDVYNNNITEFSSSIIKSASRIGSQVYIVDESGNRTGIIVIPTKNKTNTRRYKDKFEIEIEYPEIFTP